jgi:hypothetical protein
VLRPTSSRADVGLADKGGTFEFISAALRLPMSKSKPLTAEALVQLGSERLAALLLGAAAEIAAEIKRLKRGRGHIDRNRMLAFARDLSALCTAIEGPLADADPAMALERMFDFIDLAPSLIERSDDSDGHIGETMRSACEAAAELAARAAPPLPPERAAIARTRPISATNTVSPTGSSRTSRRPSMGRRAQPSAHG